MNADMTKEEFQELLKRYKEGSCSLEEIQQINYWFAKISDESLELNPLEKEQISRRLRSNVLQFLPSATKRKSIKPSGIVVLKIAASLIIVILVTYLLLPRTPVSRSNDVVQSVPSSDKVKHTNNTNGSLKILLPDSSSVELKPGSEISYSKTWDYQKREVHLIGEGFFEVVKDTRRPFYVYGGEVVTKVLGTSFSVKAAENAETIEVAVRTGKVSVYEDAHQTMSNQNGGTDATGVILTPNEKVEYFVKDNHWVTSLIEEPRPLPSANKAVEFVFSSTPIIEILNRIEETYSIDVIMENDASYSCTFTGDVSMMELYDILDVICKSTGTNYEVKGTKILITGRGCE
jgi:transmembrane sensor